MCTSSDLADFMVLFLQNDMFDLLFDCRFRPEQFQNMHKGDLYGSWTLLWNELYSECHQSPPYNPCRELSL